MHRVLPCVLFAVACGGDTSFTSTHQNEQEIEGGGDLSYAPDALVFEDLQVGITVSQEVVFTSVGDVNVTLYEVRTISTGNGTFYVPETEDRVLGPGASLAVTVTATLAEDAVAEGRLRVRSSDADFIEFTIDLLGYPVGYEPPDTGGDSGGDSGDSGA